MLRRRNGKHIVHVVQVFFLVREVAFRVGARRRGLGEQR